MARQKRPPRGSQRAAKALGDGDNARIERGIPPRHPKGTPKKPGPEDLVVFTPDHRFYWVSRDEYRKPEHEFLPDPSDLYDNLVKAGVVLAHLPPLEEVPKPMGIAECVCFLVNLASIRAQDAQKGLESRRAALSRTSTARKKTTRASRKKT